MNPQTNIPTEPGDDPMETMTSRAPEMVKLQAIPGDVVVMIVPSDIEYSASDIDLMVEMLHALVPDGVRVLAVHEGFSFQVFRPVPFDGPGPDPHHYTLDVVLGR